MLMLAEALRARLSRAEKDQKDIATAFHDTHLGLAPKEQHLSFATIQPQVARLLGADPEGDAFFFRDHHRIAALATAVGMSEDELKDLRERSRRQRILVLDPRLSAKEREFLKSRETHDGDRYRCLDASSGEPQRDILRGAVLNRPGYLVVLANQDDKSFLDGAGIASSVVVRHPRGFILEAEPDLVSLPPAPAPALFDNDGTPMLPHQEFEAEARREIKEAPGNAWNGGYHGEFFSSSSVFVRVYERIGRCDKLGTTPSFRLDEIGPWLCTRNGLSEVYGFARLDEERRRSGNGYGNEIELLYAGFRDEMAATVVWNHKRRILAEGPRAEDVRRLLEPYHLVMRPSSFSQLREALANRNPWLPPGERFQSLVAAVKEETGLVLDSVVSRWGKSGEPEGLELKDQPVAIVWNDSTAIDQARQRLEQLLERRFELPLSQANSVFRLKAVADAPLIALPLQGHESINVVAALGAGWIARVYALTFPGEAPLNVRSEFRPSYGSMPTLMILDGGNVRLWFKAIRDDVLDGSFHGVSRRRDLD